MEISNQKKELKSEIINGESNNKFQVYNIEASEGKTTVAEKAVAMSYLKTDRKSIFVRKFIIDCESTVKRINRHSKDLGLNEEIAITLNSTNQRKIKSNLNLSDIPIIVITHQKYKQLCLDVSELKLFTEGRTNLIIDEEVDMLEPITFSKEIYREFLSHLPEENNHLRKLYISYTKELLDLINTGHRNKVDSFTKDFAKFKSKELKQFKKIINSLEFDDYFFQSFPNSITQLNALARNASNLKPGMLSKRVKHIISSCTMTKSKFLKHLDDLYRMYTSTYVLMNEFGNMKIHTYDNSYYWWKLENNILLDANGGFNYIYELSNDFVLKDYCFNTDHSNWLVNFYKVKTSKKQKSKYMNYYKKVNSLMQNISRNKSKTLLISNKNEYLSDNYDVRNNDFISHDYFGNLIGSNDYRDYSSIVIAHTPYLPSFIYILKYLFYQEDRGAVKNIDIGYNHKAKFKNPELEKIKHSTMLGQIYQGIKRINRNNDKDAQVHLIIDDNKILSGIKKLLKNSRVRMINLNIKQKNDRKLSYDGKRFNNSKAKMLKLEIEKFAKEDNFSISKKSLKQSIRCSSQKFSKIINHPEVQKCITENAIIIKYHRIEKIS